MTPIGQRLGLDDRLGTAYCVDGYIAGGTTGALGEKQLYILPVLILAKIKPTGIAYSVGAGAVGEARAAIFEEEGAELIRKAQSNGAAQAAAETTQRLPFTAAPTLFPGRWWIGFELSGGGTAMSAFFNGLASKTLQGTFTIPNVIATPAAVIQKVQLPILSTY